MVVAAVPAFESSTKRMLINFKKEETSCPRLSAADVYAPIRDDKRLKNLSDMLNDTANPVSAVESAIAQLTHVDKNSADVFKQRFQDLKQKWQKGELTQNQLNEALAALFSDVKQKHLKILQLIEKGIEEGSVDTVRKSREVNEARDEIRNALDPFESKVNRLDAEQSALKDNMKIIFNAILDNVSQRDKEKLSSMTTAFGAPKLGGSSS